ncbi:hypothetical protein B0H14DRAFT_2568926 [Mycena olivaceomarginata]|nr:hypothetical protein B0H14DRAFT_2568926 [Mycena olivaceomarginata]
MGSSKTDPISCPFPWEIDAADMGLDYVSIPGDVRRLVLHELGSPYISSLREDFCIDRDAKLQQRKPTTRNIEYVNDPNNPVTLELKRVLAFLRTTEIINLACIPWPVEPGIPQWSPGYVRSVSEDVRGYKKANELRELLRIFHPDKWPQLEKFPDLKDVLYSERKQAENDEHTLTTTIPPLEVSVHSFSFPTRWGPNGSSINAHASNCPPPKTEGKKPKKYAWEKAAPQVPENFRRNLTERRRLSQDSTDTAWPLLPL